MAESKHTVEVELTIDATETIEALRATADMLEALKPKPAPIAVGDYVRLTGKRWFDSMRGKVYPVTRVNNDGNGIIAPGDGFVWELFPGDHERITVTADLDDPSNLPMPEVGEHVWVEYANNHGIRAGLVTNTRVDRGVAIEGKYIGGPMVAWGPLNDPAELTPAEPTETGACVEAAGHRYVRNLKGKWVSLVSGNAYHWGDLGNLGRVTVVWDGSFTAVER